MTSETPHRSISDDQEYYAEAFSFYAGVSCKYEDQTTWTSSVFPLKVVNKMPLDITGAQKQLRILGIGSGVGEMDCQMISQLLLKFPTISNTVIEPSHDHVESYKMLLATKDFHSKVDCHWREQTFDQYYKEMASNPHVKFHFISAIHSLYYMDNLESTILNLIGCLEEGGILLMITMIGTSGFGRLLKRFPMFGKQQNDVHSGRIKDILIKHCIKFDTAIQQSRVNITSCYEQGNRDGMLLVDFLTHIRNLQTTVSPDLFYEVMAYMRCPECSIQNGDQILFTNDWEAIMVTK